MASINLTSESNGIHLEKCESCGKPILAEEREPLTDDCEETGVVFHARCVDREEYGKCIICDDLVVQSTMNEHGECPEHYGESLPVDEEEAEDWASYREYMGKQ